MIIINQHLFECRKFVIHTQNVSNNHTHLCEVSKVSCFICVISVVAFGVMGNSTAKKKTKKTWYFEIY